MIERRRLLSLPPPPLPLGHRLTLSLLLLVVCGLLTSVRAKYIFTEEPLARDSPAAGIDSYDLFGYAAALHRVDDSGGSQDFEHAIQNTKIIVGAPNGTFPGGVSFSGVNASDAINQTGLVYECPITPGECGPLQGSGTDNDIRLFDYEGHTIGTDVFNATIMAQNEQKSGQFMGATLVSSGDHFLACAPRWISLNINDFYSGSLDKTRAHGRCFISARNLRNFVLLRPCTMGNLQSLGESYCMAGTAATLQDKEGAIDVSVYLGGPPYDESRGAVFRYDLDAANLADINQPEPFPFTNIPKNMKNEQFWYSGSAVALGNVLSNTEKDIVYSTPKSNIYRGMVQVYRLRNDKIEAFLQGEQMGEYFGWSVTTADLNGDGFDEVIVGAPLYSTQDTIELGRIFIFKNNGTLMEDNPIVMEGKVDGGRFGSAIVNLGDINSDGFEDIAVSAPYEEHTTDTEGTVYVYLGSGESYLNPTYEDRITAQEISSNLGDKYLRTFGYSMSSGVDVDANHNNDLVIGGYKSQTIVVLRTHSIANISLSLTTDPSELFDYTNDNCTLSFGSFPCFDLKIDSSFFGRGLDNRTLNVTISVREDPVSPASERLFFVDSNTNEKTKTFLQSVHFNDTDSVVSTTVKVYVENVTRFDRRSNLKMIVGLLEMEREKRDINGSQNIVDLRVTPLLNVLPKNNTAIELSLFGCQIPTMCRPQLILTQNSITYLDSKRQPSVYNQIIAGAVEFVQLVLNYETFTEDAVDSRLILTLPPQLLGAPSIRSTIPAARTMATTQCQPLEGEISTFVCDVQPIFSFYDRTLQVEVIIPVVDGITGDEASSANVTLTTRDNNIAAGSLNTLLFHFNVSAIADVKITELSVNPNSTQYENTNDLRTVITTKVTLTNNGPSAIPQSRVTILLPARTKQTGDFYYLYPERSTSPGFVTCSPLNPDGLTLNSQTRRRRKRGIVERMWREVVSGEDRRRKEREEEEGEGDGGRMTKRQVDSQTVNCAQTPEMCTPVTCNITNFSPHSSSSSSFSIIIISYVDNRFFRNQGGNFTFYISAGFNIVTKYVQGSPTSRTSNRLLVQEPDEASSRPIPVWVYVVSGLGAVVVLLVVIGLLYVFGFFRLRKKDKITQEREHLVAKAKRDAAAVRGAAEKPSQSNEEALPLQEKEKFSDNEEEDPPLPEKEDKEGSETVL